MCTRYPESCGFDVHTPREEAVIFFPVHMRKSGRSEGKSESWQCVTPALFGFGVFPRGLLLRRPGYPETQDDPPASTSPMQGLQACTTVACWGVNLKAYCLCFFLVDHSRPFQPGCCVSMCPHTVILFELVLKDMVLRFGCS